MVESAKVFAADMGRKAVAWEDIEGRVKRGLASAGFPWAELTDSQRLGIFEAWLSAFPWPEEPSA